MSEVIGQRGGGRTIILPLAAKISSAMVRRQFCVSRTTIMRWRKLHDFPAANSAGEIKAAAILAWARRHQVQIEWV